MALTTTLNYTTSLGGARLQCWTVTGDGTVKRFRHGLLRAIAVWAQNEDDATKTGTSCAVSGVSIFVKGAVMTSTNLWKIFVLGE